MKGIERIKRIIWKEEEERGRQDDKKKVEGRIG